MKLAGSLDDATFRRQLERIQKERRLNFDLLQDTQGQVDGAYLVTAQSVLELAKNAKSLWESRSTQERRDLLAKLLWNPVLEGRSVRYDLRKPFRVLHEMWTGLEPDLGLADIFRRDAHLRHSWSDDGRLDLTKSQPTQPGPEPRTRTGARKQRLRLDKVTRVLDSTPESLRDAAPDRRVRT